MSNKPTTTIEKLTAEMAMYVEIYQELDEGPVIKFLEEHETIKPTPWFPKYLHTKAYEAMDSIREAIECAEPETLADLLSLAILSRDRIHGEFPPPDDQDENQRKILAMMTTIIRGLDRLSPSHPLVTTRYFVSDRDFRTSNEEIEMIRGALRSIANDAA